MNLNPRQDTMMLIVEDDSTQGSAATFQGTLILYTQPGAVPATRQVDLTSVRATSRRCSRHAI